MNFPIEAFSLFPTPFYYYDMDRLRSTLDEIQRISTRYGYKIHYALKANSNEKILREISQREFGADCVSGNEVSMASRCGFRPDDIVFAGVGKSDAEIITGLSLNIGCFNCESIPEMEVINELAAVHGQIAPVAIRINPNINAHTHHYITTGLEENKFGINAWELEEVVNKLKVLKNLSLKGLHFHIGSQITELDVFKSLCLHVNQFQEFFYRHHIIADVINVGGGLGVDYHSPDDSSQPDFQAYFKVFHDFLALRPKQQLHFEPGRVMVAQSGTLISRVLYVKKGVRTQFAILDAGMTELLRPALYQAYHKIENLSSGLETEKYDVVGPICESSDMFGKAIDLPGIRRGDLIAIRTTGAYGEVMASGYNLRDRVRAVYSDELGQPSVSNET